MTTTSRSGCTFRIITFFLAAILSGCIDSAFLPSKANFGYEVEKGTEYHDVFLRTSDDVQIHGRFLRAVGYPKGTVLVFHGNAQNLSAHLKTVSWLPRDGYHVLMIDYRGYGYSTGKPGFPQVFQDLYAGFQWVSGNPQTAKLPLFLMGQSLGAALGAYFVGHDTDVRARLSGVILDGSFGSYRGLAREKMGESWLLWAFQYPASLLITDEYDPEGVIQNISPVPLLILHSPEDNIIPYRFGEALYRKARQPKGFIRTEGRHLETYLYPDYRQKIVDFLDQTRIR